MEIELRPYQTIRNQDYDLAEINIKPELFDNIEFNEGHSFLSFENCNFKKIVITNESEIDFKDIFIHFSFCLIQDINSKVIETEKIGIHFFSCIISGNILSNKLKSVSLNNCITKSLFLQNQNNISISYTEENIFIEKWDKMRQKTNVTSLDDLLDIKQSIYIYNTKKIRINFRHSKHFANGRYCDIGAKNNDYKIGYYLSSVQKKTLNINLSIDFNNQDDENLKIDNCILNSLSLNGSADGKISIQNTEINRFYIRDFSSTNEVLLYNVQPYTSESHMEIHMSNMDNAWFDNVYFNSYDTLSFYRSKLAQATFTSCNFPKDSITFEKFKTLKNIHYPDQKSKNYYKDQYETFLQLKKALEGTGNYFEAQKLSAISKDSLRMVSDLPISDRIILCINKNSNNHGLSIGKPLFWLFTLSILFYVLYLFSIGRIFNCNEFDFTLVGQYFSFLDITHKKDFLISKEHFSIYTLIIDFINKIVVGFFIFQFISAFRKYVKK